MKAALLILLVALVASASAIVVIDKFREQPPPNAPARVSVPPSAAPDRSVLTRLERIEKLLAEVAEMLQIPPLDPTMDSRPVEPGEDSRPLPVGLGQRLQYVEAALSDLQRQTSHDAMN